MTSLTTGILVFALVSLFAGTDPRRTDTTRTYTISGIQHPRHHRLRTTSPRRFTARLTGPLNTGTTRGRIRRTLHSLCLPFSRHHPCTLHHLHSHVRTGLSNLVNPDITRSVIRAFLPCGTNNRGCIARSVRFVRDQLRSCRSHLANLTTRLSTLHHCRQRALRRLPVNIYSLTGSRRVLV